MELGEEAEVKAEDAGTGYEALIIIKQRDDSKYPRCLSLSEMRNAIPRGRMCFMRGYLLLFVNIPMDDRETEDSARLKSYNESANSATQTALLLFAMLAIVRSIRCSYFECAMRECADISVLDSSEPAQTVVGI